MLRIVPCSSDDEYDFMHLPTRSAVFAPRLRRIDLDFCDLVNDAHISELVAIARGSLRITDYYGNIVKPHWQKLDQTIVVRDSWLRWRSPQLILLHSCAMLWYSSEI